MNIICKDKNRAIIEDDGKYYSADIMYADEQEFYSRCSCLGTIMQAIRLKSNGIETCEGIVQDAERALRGEDVGYGQNLDWQAERRKWRRALKWDYVVLAALVREALR